jgi:hypothetical protein
MVAQSVTRTLAHEKLAARTRLPYREDRQSYAAGPAVLVHNTYAEWCYV